MRLLSLILFFTLCFQVSAQGDFERLTTLDGLSQNDVYFIFQDSKGFMWFGTADGLNRYDGLSFTTYQRTSLMDHPILSNIPFCMTEDSQGNLWIGTSDAGVWLFNRHKEAFTQVPIYFEGNKIISNHNTFGLLIDAENNLWIGSTQGISVFNINDYYQGKYTGAVLEHWPDKLGIKKNQQTLSINYIEKDLQGNVLVGTALGIFNATFDTKKIDINHIDILSKYKSTSLAKTKRGYLVSCYSGIYYYQKNNDGSYIEKKVSDEFLKTLKVAKNGSIWGGGTKGLFHYTFDDTSLELKLVNSFTHDSNSSSLSRNNVVCIFEDNSGLLWIGTKSGGVNKLVLNKKKFKQFTLNTKHSDITNSKISAFLEDKKGNLWIGTEGEGFFILPQKESTNLPSHFINYSISSNIFHQDNVYSIAEIPNSLNKTLIGCGYPLKLAIVSFDNNKIILNDLKDLVNSPVFVIFNDKDGYIWLGTYGSGLYKTIYNAKTNSLEVINHFQTTNKNEKGNLSSNIIRSIIEDKKGNILIGTDYGLTVLPANQKYINNPTFKVYRNIIGDASSLAHNYILDSYLDKKGRTWLGLMGAGLCQVITQSNGDFTFKTYSTKDGLPNNVVKSIEEDRAGNLWLSSNKGLTRFNPQTLEIRNYSVEDGLQDYEFSEIASCKRKSGEMLFGGVNGVNVFLPSDIVDNTFSSHIEFTNLSVLNQEILPGKKYNNRTILVNDISSTPGIELSYSENSFSIGFAAMHFVAPQKIQYKYLLEGFDADWVTVLGRDPQARYTNIPPGSYVLKVLATNNDGVWNTDAATFNIEITPPFWRSAWAFMVYALLIITALLFFRKYSLIANTKKNQLLMQRFEQEKMEELVQMKLQFFTNISHEFRTPLTLIQSPLEKLITEGPNVDEAYRQKSYSLMMKSISILNRLINQLLDFRKLEYGKMPIAASKANIVEHVKSATEIFTELAASKNITFSFVSTSDEIDLWFDAEKIEKVLFNLLSNSFKFTPIGGQISIEIGQERIKDIDWVCIKVSDNGQGIDANKIPFLFDRFYQAERHKLSKVSGTGIGLAFSNSLIALHHGSIEVTSIPNVKTSFTVRLQLGKNHFASSDCVQSETINDTRNLNNVLDYDYSDTQTSTNTDVVGTDKPVILIVEDNLDVQSFIKENLEKEFYCLQAYDGIQGLNLARQHSPNLIVSDVMMPLMDGYEMCHAIKQDEAICHIPIVMLTAKYDEDDKITGLKEGAEAYIAKPFNIDVLIAQIKSILEARSMIRHKFGQKMELEPSEVTFTSIDEKLMERLIKVIEANMSNAEFTVAQLATEVGMSQTILNRKLKALIGETANVFIRTIRLKRAAQLLKLDRLSVSDIVYEVGFNDMKYFRECFRKQFDTTPTEYVKKSKE